MHFNVAATVEHLAKTSVEVNAWIYALLKIFHENVLNQKLAILLQ